MKYSLFKVCFLFTIFVLFFFFQAEVGIRDLVRSRGLGDVYKRQIFSFPSIKEDLALVVDESVTAEQVEQAIRQAGGLSLIHI